ncbi:Cytochrome C [Gammaproteobacteria bacterium]
MNTFSKIIGMCIAIINISAVMASNAQEQLKVYSTETQQLPNSSRGEIWFSAKHGREWSCASCHTRMPTREGRHAATGKLITPLAPTVNPTRFTNMQKTEKWFRRNCNDVLNRECTAAEKSDVLAWLLSLVP